MKALSLDPGCEEAVCSLASLLIRENNAKEGLKFVKRFLVRGNSPSFLLLFSHFLFVSSLYS